MSTPLGLLCYVRGDRANRVFEVEIDRTCKIATLKKAIKEEKKHAFNHIDADTLELWQVSIPDSDDLKEDVEEYLSKKQSPLHDAEILSRIFTSEPEEETISIVIERPEISLLCYVQGDNSTFLVKVGRQASVGDLKKAIKEEKKHAFNHIAANTLELWQVSIPDSDDLKEDVEKELPKAGNSLRSGRNLSDLFKRDPKKGTISIVIERPEISLLCYVQGDNSTFLVKVGRQASVGDLKKAIKEEKKHAFNHIAAKSLELWQVSIPDSDDLKEDVEKELPKAGNPLRSGRNLSDLFKRDPKKGTISIVIERPEISLLCYVQGDNSTFLVKVGRQASVGDLKKAIKEEKKNAFNHIDADTLELCQVSLPVSEVLEEAVDAFDGDKVALTLPTTIVKELFPHEPSKGHVQIIVEAPQTVTGYMGLRRELFQHGPNHAPSTDAEAEKFWLIQHEDRLFYACCRPPEREHSIPLTLLDSVFGTFVDDCEKQSLVSEDYSTARELRDMMCGFYGSEGCRLNAVRTILENYGISLDARSIGPEESPTNIHLLKGDHPVIILEGKNEIRQGTAEPTLQGLLYYKALCKSGKIWREKFSCHPCFAIVLAGPYLGFGGYALTDLCTMEMFSSLPLTFRGPDEPPYTALARHLSALKKAVNTLITRYVKAPCPSRTVKAPINPGLSVFPPYPKTFHPLLDQNLRVTFSYDMLMEGRDLIFIGRRDNHWKPICIKFVRRYGQEVHSWCADRGFAPKLIAFDKLPGGWYMVVMEWLDGSWAYPDDISCQREGLRESMQTALVRLHQEGMVHGDIRGANILVKKDGGREFMLLDFDWAGREGEVKYPPFINKNPMLMRPADVSDCAPILAAHDSIMFQNIFV